MNRYFIYVIFYYTFILSNQTHAQFVSDTSKQNMDTINFYKKFFDYLSVKLDIVDSDNERFVLKGADFEYDIRPNVAYKSKLSVNYKFISFAISYLPKFLPGNNDNDLKGETKGMGYGLTLNFKHWIHKAQYTSITGFYLDNSSDYVPGWVNNQTPYIQFPELKVKSFQGSSLYKVNSKLSLNAISTQTEIQLKSTGSFIPGILYSYYIIDDKSNSSSQQSSQKSNNIELIATIGYVYTFVLNKHWYASAGISPSFGVGYTSLLTRISSQEIESDFYNSIFRINGNVGLGYNSDRFFAGGELKAFRAYRKQDETTVTLAKIGGSFQIFIGYRFKAPKPLRKLVDKIESKIPFKD